jgi:phosphocarrier protein
MIIKYKVIDASGLHIRPASLMVQIASQYSDQVDIIHGGKQLTLKSILSIMSLGIPYGDEFEIFIEGRNEEKIKTEIENLLKEHGVIE